MQSMERGEKTGSYSFNAKEALPDVPISMSKRALHNFKTHFKRFLGISLAVTIAVCAILMSFSSQNIIEEKINHFEQKNTAFSWGQILLKENDKVEDVLSLLERSPDIQQYYIQYPVPECKIEFGGHSLSVPPKQFGSIFQRVHKHRCHAQRWGDCYHAIPCQTVCTGYPYADWKRNRLLLW